MGLRINQNIAAMNSYRNLSNTDNQLSKSLEKLSSGFRINRAADDAAGLAISEGLRSQVGGLKVAVRNSQDGISVVQTAEGALNESHSILQRMRDLSVQASNDGGLNDDAKGAIQSEIGQLKSELTRSPTPPPSTARSCSTATTTARSRSAPTPERPSASRSVRPCPPPVSASTASTSLS
jgi:flagellin